MRRHKGAPLLGWYEVQFFRKATDHGWARGYVSSPLLFSFSLLTLFLARRSIFRRRGGGEHHCILLVWRVGGKTESQHVFLTFISPSPFFHLTFLFSPRILKGLWVLFNDANCWNAFHIHREPHIFLFLSLFPSISRRYVPEGGGAPASQSKIANILHVQNAAKFVIKNGAGCLVCTRMISWWLPALETCTGRQYIFMPHLKLEKWS